jgi:hypothetical protein
MIEERSPLVPVAIALAIVGAAVWYNLVYKKKAAPAEAAQLVSPAKRAPAFQPSISVPAAPVASSRMNAPDRPTIYVCRTPSGVIYADKPCGPDAQEHVPKGALSVIDPGRVVPVPRQNVMTSQRTYTVFPAAQAQETGNHAACASLFAQKDQLEARMRKGYRSAEGEYLRDAHRQLTRRLNDLDCEATG